MATIGYIMRDNQSNIIMAKSKRLRDCPTLVFECLTMREAILMAIQKGKQRIIIQSNFQLVVNSLSEKI